MTYICCAQGAIAAVPLPTGLVLQIPSDLGYAFYLPFCSRLALEPKNRRSSPMCERQPRCTSICVNRYGGRQGFEVIDAVASFKRKRKKGKEKRKSLLDANSNGTLSDGHTTLAIVSIKARNLAFRNVTGCWHA